VRGDPSAKAREKDPRREGAAYLGTDSKAGEVVRRSGEESRPPENTSWARAQAK